MKLSRRTVARAIAGAPVALVAASIAPLEQILGRTRALAAEAAEPEATPSPESAPEDSALGRFLAREEEGLTGEERRRVRRDVAQLEQALKAIRDFQIGNDVAPSGTFKALRTRRSHGR